MKTNVTKHESVTQKHLKYAPIGLIYSSVHSMLFSFSRITAYKR